MIHSRIETDNYDQYKVVIYSLMGRGFFFKISWKKRRHYVELFDSEPWELPEVYRLHIARQLGYIAYLYFRSGKTSTGGLSNLIKQKLTTPKKRIFNVHNTSQLRLTA